MSTLQEPGDMKHTPRHAPWCSPAEHYDDPDDGTANCYNTPLRLGFGERGPHDDAVPEAVFCLQRRNDATQLSILAGLGMSLDPDQIRPMAMALLAMDATVNGDLDLAAYYENEARHGAAETAGA